MTSDLETTRIVRSWLREDDDDSADGILDEALALLDSRPQFGPIGRARGLGGLRTEAKFGLAIAAAIAIAVIGFGLVRSTGPGIVPAPTPAPTPAPAPSQRATPTPAVTPDANGDIWRTGVYGVGRHTATLDGVPFSFAIPSSGWSSYAWKAMLEKGSFPSPDYAWIGFQWGGTEVNDIDPCRNESSGTTGPTIDDIAEAYTRIPGTEAVGPTDITLDGRPGKKVVININDDIQCFTNAFVLDSERTWPDAVTSEITMWFVDVGGRRFSIHVDRTAPNGQLEQEIREIIDSIRFE